VFKKILYVGAGDDVKQMNSFPSSNFVCIDSLPRNSYGYPYYYRGYYHQQFKQRVIDKLRDLSFCQTGDEKKFSDFYSEINVTNLDSHLVTFNKDGEGDTSLTLNYYFSTGIPENLYDGNGDLNEELTKDISDCDTIFVKGHWPHEDIMLHTKKPINFIGAYNTYFPENREELENDDNNEKDTVISYILNHPESICSYSYLTKSGELAMFLTYDEFYRFYNIFSEYKDD